MRKGEGREKTAASEQYKRREAEECLRGEDVRRRKREEIRLNTER